MGVRVSGKSPPLEAWAEIASKKEKQSGSKDLERGSFRLWEIIACVKPNVSICLGR